MDEGFGNLIKWDRPDFRDNQTAPGAPGSEGHNRTTDHLFCIAIHSENIAVIVLHINVRSWLCWFKCDVQHIRRFVVG